MIDEEDLLVGLTYLILPLVILPFYLIILRIFVKDPHFSGKQSYKLQTNLGFFDCVQLLFHSTAGVFTFFPDLCDFYYVNKFMGATLNCAWIGLFPATLLIALNRFLIIRRKIDGDHVLPWHHKILLALGWLYTGAFYVSLLSIGSLSYSPADYSWSYHTDKISSSLSDLEYVVSVTLIVITLILHIGSVISLVQLRNMASASWKIYNQEKKMLAQAVIVFTNLTLLISAWHYYYIFLPSTKETFFLINCYWILYCGLNPVLYLTMNSKVRRRFVDSILCRKYSNDGGPISGVMTTSPSRIHKISSVA